MSETELELKEMQSGALPRGHATLYPPKVREAIDSIPQEYLEMDPEILTKMVKPTLSLYQLKMSFHKETLQAVEDSRKVVVRKLIGTSYSNRVFYKKVITSPKKMAWLMSSLVRYEDKTKAALLKISERYEELISMDITIVKNVKIGDEWTSVTETCPRKAGILLSVIKNLEDRIKGTSIQRQINIHTPKPEGDSKMTLDMEAVENKLKELESKLGVQNEDKDVRGPIVVNNEPKDK